MKSANVSPEIAAMAYELADSVARSDIECGCRMKWLRWYDTRQVPEQDRETVDKALRYLRARGIIIEHKDDPSLVNFEGMA